MTAPTFAQGSRSQLIYKVQSDFLTQPAAPFTRARFSTHTLDYVKATVESDEIRSDRLVEDYRHTQGKSQGDIVTNLIYADCDWLLQSLMFNTYNSTNLDIGTTPQYYFVEDGSLDINAYKTYLGLVVSKAVIDIKPNGMVRLTCSMAGGAGAISGGSVAGGSTTALPTNNKPFDSWNAGVYPADSASGAKFQGVSSIQLTIDNSVSMTSQVGYQNPQAIEFGRARVTGTMSVYYQDTGFINDFINETERAMDISLTDPSSNTMTFQMPRIKYNGASAPVANEKSRMVTLPFVALRDTVSTRQLRITK